MTHSKNLQEAQEICAQFSGYSVARSAKTINKIYRPYQLLDSDLQPLFAFDSVLASYLYLGGYLVKNGGILQAANPKAEKKSCDHACSPSDYYPGGKCDKMGCYHY